MPGNDYLTGERQNLHIGDLIVNLVEILPVGTFVSCDLLSIWIIRFASAIRTVRGKLRASVN